MRYIGGQYTQGDFMNKANDPNHQDDYLWKVAKKRVALRKSFYYYVVVNLFLWLVWFATTKNYTAEFPWPLYPTLGWGLAVAIQYFNICFAATKDPVTTEYEKLKQKEKR